MKTYRFDYLKEWVDKWFDKTHITLSQLYILPWDVALPWFMPDEEYIPPKDHYGDVIDDIDEWSRQREEYLKNLWEELGSYKDPYFENYE